MHPSSDFGPLSLLRGARFANSVSNLPVVSLKKSRICRGILRDEIYFSSDWVQKRMFRAQFTSLKKFGRLILFLSIVKLVSSLAYHFKQYGTKHSLVYNLIVYNHYRTFQEILKSHAACCLTLLQVPVCYIFGLYRREILRSRLRANINNSIKLKTVLLSRK